MNTIIPIFAFFLFVIALITCLFGRFLIEFFPIIKKLRKIKSALSSVYLKTGIIRRYRTTIPDISDKKITEVYDFNYCNLSDSIKEFRFGKACELISCKEKKIKHIVKELRIYGLVIVFFEIAAFLFNLGGNNFEISLHDLWIEYSSDPSKFFAGFEAFMFIFFSIRLVIELNDIAETINNE